jgi:hypothetical protein
MGLGDVEPVMAERHRYDIDDVRFIVDNEYA